jgi:hypothetical protein
LGEGGFVIAIIAGCKLAAQSGAVAGSVHDRCVFESQVRERLAGDWHTSILECVAVAEAAPYWAHNVCITDLQNDD